MILLYLFAAIGFVGTALIGVCVYLHIIIKEDE